jgi:PAS domain S-box-containing protein
LIGATTFWFIFNSIKEKRIEDVGQIAEARHEAMRTRLLRDNQRSQGLLATLVAVCRYSDAGINACVKPKLEQFAIINHSASISFHSGVESDLALGRDAIPWHQINQPFLSGQIASISPSKITTTPLFSLRATDMASGFSLVTTYSGQLLQDIFISAPALGQSGETFLADNQGYFITKPRYPSEQGIIKPISAIPMQHCLHKENNEMLDFDYRNVPIIHGFRFVPEIGGGCIMAHIDQAEAFAPLTRLFVAFIGITFLLTGLAWLIAKTLSTSITKPIMELADMVQALSAGNFTQRVFLTKYGEIAQLSQLFNSMTGKLDDSLKQLKASERELEQKVIERTAELDKRHKRYHSVIQTTSDGFWRLDSAGHLLEVNPAYIRLSGYSETELLAMQVADLDARENPKETAEHIQKVIQQGWEIFETQHRCKNGNVWDVEVNVSFVDNDDCCFICFLRDITERKQHQEEIERLSDSELNKAKLEAERASQAKSEFLASMSHELRTPMNAVLGFAQLLDCEELTEEQHDSVKEILTAGYHLLDLINEVLDLSKIEAEKLELKQEQIDLYALMQICLSLVRSLTVKNSITIIDNTCTNCHVSVMADRLRFKQILVNLISNAIKYNRIGGSVTISCEVVNLQMLKVNVTDTGQGLSEEQLAKLFQPFERLTAKNSAIEGTGIGLCISKKLIEAMNGKIGVSSSVGEGSCFWVEIPLSSGL